MCLLLVRRTKLHWRSVTYSSRDGGNKFPWNVGQYLHVVEKQKTAIFKNTPDLKITLHNECLSSSFLVFRNPTPAADPLLDVTWPPYTVDNHLYLNVDKELTLQHDLNKDRLQFWKDLYASVRQ